MKPNHPIAVFLFKCIFASLPLLLLIGYTALFPFAYMDAEYPSWAYTRAVVSGKQPASTDAADEADMVLILGDSRAMADLIPSELGNPAQNLALGGATTIEMYYTLSDYLSSHDAPSTAVILFAPFHYSYIDNFWQRTVYFNYLSVPQMLEVFANAKTVSSETVLQEHHLIDSLSYLLRLPNKYLPALINSRLYERFDENNASYQKLCAENGHGLFGTAKGSSDLNYEVNYTEMKTSGDAALIALYFDKLLALCDEYNIYAIVEQPPMNESSYKKLQKSYLAEYSIYIEERQTEYPFFSIDHTITFYGNDFFGDASHLNEKGALAFTRDLKEKYKNILSTN